MRFGNPVCVPLMLAALAATGCKPASPVSEVGEPVSANETSTLTSQPELVESYSTPALDPAANAIADQLAASENAFFARLHAAILTTARTEQDNQAGNLFYSPASIRIALAMAYAGARGETAAEMATALELGSQPEQAHKGFAALLRHWAALAEVELPDQANDWMRSAAEQEAVRLRVVNRIWGAAQRTFTPAFLDTLKQDYAAPLETLDFARAAEPSRVRINAWVKEQTEGKIIDLIPPNAINANTSLVLTNAVYFKGFWRIPFAKGATAQSDFFAGATRPVRIDFMHQTTYLPYGETDDAQILELPYGRGDLAMLIVLPRERAGLNTLERNITVDSLARWTDALDGGARVSVALPKFRSGSSLRLADVLRAMGMKQAFAYPGADFSGADGTKELFIGEVFHQAVVSVDEEGTEAAAATATIMPTGAAIQTQEPVPFICDHPFLYFVRDTQTGSILFAGRMMDPSGE
jgi:serpin B